MGNDLAKINKETAVSLGVVILLFGSVFYLGVLTKQVATNERDISAIKMICDDNPSRVEFDQMRSDIDEIKKDVKSLLTTH